MSIGPEKGACVGEAVVIVGQDICDNCDWDSYSKFFSTARPADDRYRDEDSASSVSGYTK